jgi:hypothetical protein
MLSVRESDMTVASRKTPPGRPVDLVVVRNRMAGGRVPGNSTG